MLPDTLDRGDLRGSETPHSMLALPSLTRVPPRITSQRQTRIEIKAIVWLWFYFSWPAYIVGNYMKKAWLTLVFVGFALCAGHVAALVLSVSPVTQTVNSGGQAMT